MNAVISLLLSAIWHWASTTPGRVTRPTDAAPHCRRSSAPRLVLPSTATCGNRGRCRPRVLFRAMTLTSRLGPAAGLTIPGRPHPGTRLRAGRPSAALQPPTHRGVQRVTVEPGTQPPHGLLVRADIPAGRRIHPGVERLQRLLRTPGDPLPDRVHRHAPGQHRGQRQPEHRRQPMPDTPRRLADREPPTKRRPGFPARYGPTGLAGLCPAGPWTALISNDAGAGTVLHYVI